MSLKDDQLLTKEYTRGYENARAEEKRKVVELKKRIDEVNNDFNDNFWSEESKKIEEIIKRLVNLIYKENIKIIDEVFK